jgi:hypothetical protein
MFHYSSGLKLFHTNMRNGAKIAQSVKRQATERMALQFQRNIQDIFSSSSKTHPTEISFPEGKETGA